MGISETITANPEVFVLVIMAIVLAIILLGIFILSFIKQKVQVNNEEQDERG